MNTIIKPLGFPWETQDPFLFCAHHRDEYPTGNDNMGPSTGTEGRNIGQDFTIREGWRMYHGRNIPGFPYHPHRGFETITINKEGIVDHSDSLGAAGRFGAGDVQWMTAGKGVQHSEMFPLIHQDKANTLEIFQIWLNLPKKSKFVDPHFKMLWNDDVPHIVEKDRNDKTVTIDLIAGNYQSVNAAEPTPDSWASNPEHAVRVMTVELEANANWTLPATLAEASSALYFYRGDSLTVDGQTMPEYSVAYLQADRDIEIQNKANKAYILILQGVPIKEPVVQYGPFVMNTEAEIRQAYDDYRRTEFGGWPWPLQEQVHPRDKGRFALHADGRQENK